jgi:GNAT superfamily N-acetyltransferase
MIVYREMQMADIAGGLALARAMGWNQLPRDWEQYLRLDPHGARVALRDEQIVGTVGTMRYGDRFAWIGMMLVDPALQRQGVGRQLMRDALEVLRDQRTVRLDATPAGRGLYQKLGFVEEYDLSRLERAASAPVTPVEPHSARPMTAADLPLVCEFDGEVFGADRRAMIEWVFAGAPRYAWIVCERARVAGFCFGRTGFRAEYLGPVIAADAAIARQLVSACLAQHAGRPFFLDATHHDADWLRWLETIGFREQRLLTRMVRGEGRHPGLPAKQFGILGPEFG